MVGAGKNDLEKRQHGVLLLLKASRALRGRHIRTVVEKRAWTARSTVQLNPCLQTASVRTKPREARIDFE